MSPFPMPGTLGSVRRPAAVSPSAFDDAREQLAHRGWVALRGLPFLRGGRPDHRAVLDLAARFGVPSARDGGTPLWPVAPCAHGGGSTFSTRTGPAGFHTDAQYHPEPEDYVCLFGVRPAADGGRTRLLRYDDAIAAIAGIEDGGRLLAALRRPVWRWRAPLDFGGGTRDFPPAAVLPGAGRIRWRGDNVEGPPDEPAGIAARIDAALDRAPNQVTLTVGSGDLLVLDNHRVLHARTAFTDPRRLLLRVRLWEAA